jgi:pyrroloquinoline quinone biosynthesis protein B
MKYGSYILILTAAALISSCHSGEPSPQPAVSKKLPNRFVAVLGIAQDAGYPQAGCNKECCAAYYAGKEEKKHITCLALVDNIINQYWLFEATPDMAHQVEKAAAYTGKAAGLPAGIFITHAHIGHYTGLMQLGREVMGTKAVSVYAMPRLDSFLRNNGPWGQLVNLDNIRLNRLKEDSAVQLGTSFNITPIKVPHRDEYSETVGFMIQSDKKKLLFIPDIDKWDKWERDITAVTKQADIALLDGTFYKNGELPGRDMSEVPHPFVEESLKRFSSLTSAEKEKITFIHFNHTNPLLKKHSAEKESVKRNGFGVAEEGMIIEL